jgi:hypothetical protein
VQRLAAYCPTLWIEQANANDDIATYAAEGIAHIEDFLADSALVSV